VTAREFEPLDYAGDPIEWIDMKTGEVRKAWAFVAGLGFSQLLYAWAAHALWIFPAENHNYAHYQYAALTEP
jgi:transposase